MCELVPLSVLGKLRSAYIFEQSDQCPTDENSDPCLSFTVCV